MRPSDRYHKWIERSGEDNACLGRCPDDVITGIRGSDPIRLYQELCEVVDDVLLPSGHPSANADTFSGGWSGIQSR